MKPLLFAKNATTFTTNGLGRIDCISCKVTEERNGQYELEMVVPEDGAHVAEIEMSSIIVVKPSQNGSIQPFRVYKISKPLNGQFAVLAQHISYQLSYIPCMPFSVQASSSACNQTLQALKTNSAENNPFTFWTNVTTVAPYAQATPASIRQRLGGVEGSVLDQFGGEYEWDNYTVKLWSNRGVTTPTVTLRYGKNITDISQEEYISNTITGVCPFWTDSEGNQLVTLPEKVVESQYADNYPFKRTVPLDMSQDFQNKPSESQLRTAATAYVSKAGIGVPTVSVKVSFINLADTEEYKDIAPLQNVSLCDRINVQFEKLGISATAQIVKTVYNVLNEKYDSIEVGTVRPSLASTITDQNASITAVQNDLTYKIQNATSWLTNSNGYVIAVKNTDGSWKELIFADHNDPAQWHNLLRINENGMGFSSDGGQTYKQAWTLDGKLVIGGTNVPSLTVYKTDAQTQTLFQVSRDGIIWNVPNSSMTANGTLTATGAQLSNAQITGGSLYQENSGRHLQLVNGNIHGGFEGSDNILYLAYRVDNTECIALKANGICFESNDIYVRDGVGGSVYSGYSGNVITNLERETIYDYDGNPHEVVTGWSSRNVTHGIIR